MRGGGVVALALVAASATAFAQEAEPPAPLNADLKNSEKMAVAPPAIDTKIDIKPNLKKLPRRRVISNDEMCSMVNTQRIDMGRGLRESAPRACRRNGSAYFGPGDFKGLR